MLSCSIPSTRVSRICRISSPLRPRRSRETARLLVMSSFVSVWFGGRLSGRTRSHCIRQPGEQATHSCGRRQSCARLQPAWGTIASATHRHCRGPGNGLRSGSSDRKVKGQGEGSSGADLPYHSRFGDGLSSAGGFLHRFSPEATPLVKVAPAGGLNGEHQAATSTSFSQRANSRISL